MSSNLLTFLIWLGATAVLVWSFLFTARKIIRKHKIKKLAAGQYYDSFVRSEEPYIVRVTEINRTDGWVTYLTTDRGVILSTIDKFVQSFDKMSAKKVEKYKHLLPA